MKHIALIFLCCTALWANAQQATSQADAEVATAEVLAEVSGENLSAIAQAEGISETQSAPETIKNVQLANLKLGFVNFRRIMGAIPQLNAIRQALDAEFKAQQEDLLRAQDELTEMERKIATTASSDLDYDTIEKQMIAKRRDVARKDAALRDNYSVRRNEELAKLQRKVLDQIVNLAKEQGYDVILNDNGVLYVSESADLTSLVIERLNQLSDQEGNSLSSDSLPPLTE